MKEYKLGWRYWFFLILFSGVLLIGGKAVFMLFAGQVTMEDGTIDLLFNRVMAVALSVVLLTYLITVINLVKFLVLHRGCGLSITYQGIENTAVFINVLAFVLVLPVKLIPWEAVTYVDDEAAYIRVNTKFIQAGFLAKLILKIFGFNFCHSFVKPKVKLEDILVYQHLFKINPIFYER